MMCEAEQAACLVCLRRYVIAFIEESCVRDEVYKREGLAVGKGPLIDGQRPIHTVATTLRLGQHDSG